MLGRVLSRGYVTIPGSKVKIIDDFYQHLLWMREKQPTYAVLYFKNNWNPECSAKLEAEFLKSVQNQPFEAFLIDGTMGKVGERTKKYYSVKYEPTFLLLSDGMEAKRLIGGDINAVKTELERVRLFRSNVKWGLGMSPANSLWEDFHDEHMKEWRQYTEGDTREWDGTLVFDRT